MSEFTKGPWVSGYGEGVTGPTSPNCAGPCVAGRSYPYTVVSKGMNTIAIIPIQNGGEMQENADLISAAPDMYGALYELDKLMDFDELVPDNTAFTFDDSSLVNKTFRMCREAIIKAKGESHV